MTIGQVQGYVSNLMVPAGGQPNLYALTGGFTGTPYNVDFRQYSLDTKHFQPQGVFVDNYNGTQPVIITFSSGYRFIVKAGQIRAGNFPAINGGTCTIVGDPAATNTYVAFVDYPVLPEIFGP